MIGILVAGAIVGLGLWLVVRAFTARPNLAEGVAALHRPGRPIDAIQPSAGARLQERLVEWAIELLRVAGFDASRRATDLRISGRSVERHVADKLTGALLGIAGGLILSLPVASLGAGPGLPMVVALGGAVVGFLLPDARLTETARRRRRAFRHAYGAYLDLVNVMMATGAGPETALRLAAEQGAGWAFTEIREALEAARRTRASLQETFTQLGRELDVSELAELGSAVALVGSEGARIRDTLAAKADTLRAQQVAEIEAASESATERMTVPLVVLLLAFLLFIGYPAIAEIASIGTSP
jgi:Flp pilus assembly protein TadB